MIPLLSEEQLGDVISFIDIEKIPIYKLLINILKEEKQNSKVVSTLRIFLATVLISAKTKLIFSADSIL